MTTRAKQFDFLLAGLRDPDTGLALNGGVVYFYEVGSSATKNVWTESDKTNAYTSYTLDTNGVAELYGDGNYKIVVKDSSAETEYTFDVVKTSSNEFIVTTVTSASVNVDGDDDVIIANSSSNSITINLAAVAGFSRPLTVKKISANNTVTIDANGSETIDGSLTYAMTADDDVVTLIPDVSAGTWYKSADLSTGILGLDASVADLNQVVGLLDDSPSVGNLYVNGASTNATVYVGDVSSGNYGKVVVVRSTGATYLQSIGTGAAYLQSLNGGGVNLYSQGGAINIEAGAGTIDLDAGGGIDVNDGLNVNGSALFSNTVVITGATNSSFYLGDVASGDYCRINTVTASGDTEIKTYGTADLDIKTVNSPIVINAGTSVVNIVGSDIQINSSSLLATAAEINTACDGITATAAEINTACDGITATAAEINYICDPGSTTPFKTAVIEIGIWNMDSTTTKQVSHGMSLNVLIGAIAFIRNDAADEVVPLSYPDPAFTVSGYLEVTNTIVNLHRVVGGRFDSTLFDNSNNRGHVIIFYL